MANVTFKAAMAIGAFVAGQVIKGDAIPDYLRTVYNAQTDNGATDLSDEQLTAIANGIDSEEEVGSEAWLMDVCEAIANQDVPGEETITGQLAENVMAVAAKIAKDDVINDTIIPSTIEAGNTIETSPVFIVERLMADLSVEERALIPFPGSTTGNNPDKVEGSRIVNGEHKPVKRSVIAEIIALQPRVQEIDKALSNIQTQEGVELTTDQRTERDNLRKDRVNAIRAYVRAFKVLHVASLFDNSRFLTLEIEPADKDGRRKTYCLAVVNKHKPREGRNLAVNSFIRLTGIKADTTFPQFLDMLKRKQRNKGPEQASAEIPTPSAGQVVPMAAAMTHALENNGIYSVVFGALKKTEGELGEAAELAIDTLASLEDCLAELLDKVGRDRVGKVVRKLRAQAEARGVAA